MSPRWEGSSARAVSDVTPYGIVVWGEAACQFQFGTWHSMQIHDGTTALQGSELIAVLCWPQRCVGAALRLWCMILRSALNEIKVLCILHCNFFNSLSVQCSSHRMSRLRGALFAGNVFVCILMMQYYAFLHWSKEKNISDLPESLLPELGPRDPDKDRGSSAGVAASKETICLWLWSEGSLLQTLAPDASEGTGGWWVVIFLFLLFDTS